MNKKKYKSILSGIVSACVCAVLGFYIFGLMAPPVYTTAEPPQIELDIITLASVDPAVNSANETKQIEDDLPPQTEAVSQPSRVLFENDLIDQSESDNEGLTAAETTVAAPQDSEDEEATTDNTITDESVIAEPKSKPQIAIVIQNLGQNRQQTIDAINMPAPINISIQSFADMAGSWFDKAIQAGHEIYAQIAMEPLNYPQYDPGPETLLTSLPSKENITRLEKAISLHPALEGVTVSTGKKFAESASKLEAVLQNFEQTDLIWVDNIHHRASLIQQIAEREQIPYIKADENIDAVVTEEAISNSLRALEKTALFQGYAVGFASPYPMTLEKLQSWLDNLDTDKFDIVPISKIINQ